MEYAVVETGGKQYTVRPGQTLRVEKLERASDSDSTIEFDKVLLVVKEESLKIGQPFINGATVRADFVADGKADKIIAMKFKPKVRYKRKIGHRQPYTELRITEILDGEPITKPRRTSRTRKAPTDGS